MPDAVSVTGATGLAGANVCEQLIQRGDAVRAEHRTGCNRAGGIAGVDDRVEDLEYRPDPEALTEAFGPTLMAIAVLGLLIPWLRELGRP